MVLLVNMNASLVLIIVTQIQRIIPYVCETYLRTCYGCVIIHCTMLNAPFVKRSFYKPMTAEIFISFICRCFYNITVFMITLFQFSSSIENNNNINSLTRIPESIYFGYRHYVILGKKVRYQRVNIQNNLYSFNYRSTSHDR